MSDVGNLLARVGLKHNAGLFEDPGVDAGGLLSLTERELADLGLTASARQALLRKTRSPDPAQGPPARLAPTGGERRQLTLLFCDLVDSVGLSNRLDPEDLRDVIGAYQRVCTHSIRRYEGHVARYVGDGILAFCGYPTAHEDDAERAIRAGRDVVEAVARLNDELTNLNGFRLQARVGIATGLVVVGDMTTGGVTEKDAVAGEAANLASRLQNLARPGTVVVSALTRDIAAEAFAYRDLGRQRMKGFDAPVAAYEVVAERQVTRLEARNAAQTPFVNRDKELAVILGAWARAAAGHGQVLIVAGEAGIGKSRIVAEGCAMLRRLDPPGEAEDASPLVFQCAPYHANSALYPVIRQLSMLAGIDRADADAGKLEKLGRLLHGPLPERDRTLALLGELLDIGPKEREAPLARNSPDKRELTMAALVDWCASRLSERPLIIVFEDFQWIDPTSRLFLRRLIDWAERVRALIIITVRNEAGTSAAAVLEETRFLATGGRSLSYVTPCVIAEMSRAATSDLIAAAAKGSALSADDVSAILEKSAGLPLYAEELTKSLLQTRSAADSRAQGRPRPFPVPHTISDALMARLDQLGQAREIAQYASVIGGEFSLRLLVRVAAIPVDEVVSHLQSLVESGIVAPVDSAAGAYRFRHALIRDVSYDSLLNRRRRQIHRKIATELAQSPRDPSTATDDLVAQHHSLGGEHRQAITFWQRGATEAIARSAHEEALGMLASAFNDLRKLQGSDLALLELDLVLSQVMALRWLRGYPSAEFQERLVRARELCEATGSDEKLFDVEWGLLQYSLVRADVGAAREIATALFEHAAHHPDQPMVDAYLANGMVALVGGEFERARKLFEKGLALSHPETDEPHFSTHGQNPGLFCLCYLAQTLCLLGYLDLAKATIERGLSIAAMRARDPAHISGHVNALTFAVRVYQFCDDVASERRLAEEMLSIARRNQYAYYEALSRCHLGWVTGAEGRLSEGIDSLLEGITALEQLETSLALPRFYTLLAELYIRSRRVPEAQEALARATGRNGMSGWDAEIERVRGDIMLLQAEAGPHAAEAAYRSSLAIATRQSARSLMLKAALRLSDLLRPDRPQEAREILARCLAQMPAGSDMPDVQRAKAVVEGLPRV